MFSKAKEGAENSIVVWYRKKYELSPKDPRFLEMTFEEIQEEWLIDKLHENPELTLQDLAYDSSSDEEWMASVEQKEVQETLKKIFSKSKDSDFEEVERETR